MKIIHTADWHLGNTFHGHERTAEHRHFLNWLVDTLAERRPDALILAGDVFDSPNPSAAAQELLYDFLLRATAAVPGLQIVITAGNHDSGARLEAPASLLKMHNVYVRGLVHRTDNDEPDFDFYLLPLSELGSDEAVCVCAALPFLRGGDYPSGLNPADGLAYYFENLRRRFRKSEFSKLPLFVAAHFYASGADVCNNEHSERLVVGGQDCVDAGVVGREAVYTALGHIHKAQQVGGARNVFYAGSALPLSFSEIAYEHGVQFVTIDHEGEVTTTRIPYEPLRKLQRIPDHGDAVAAVDVVAEISKLPKRKKSDDGSNWPYLEIRVRESQPEPTLMHSVTEALSDRAVHFCRMVRVAPQATGEAQASLSQHGDTLQAISPLKMARQLFTAKFSEEMPPEMVSRFKQAEAAAIDEAE